MQIYSIYWIKETFAKHFFYKSDIVYRFIKTYHATKRDDLVRQFQFITHSFSEATVQSQLTKYLAKKYQIQYEGNSVIITSTTFTMTVYIYEKYIVLYCHSLEEAEAVLFPIFRLLDLNFFIMSHTHPRFGWIASLMDKKDKRSRNEVLYS
ncbi:MAG TPA: sporulation inhibitor of replication protein SirA [Cerasibacillus sp.]|uniref:sporulation inhibitor of replication protein SirA n=1 Tax=Cerasibacillus sp. TaxID=2498711 RepID=UPI002F3ED08E